METFDGAVFIAGVEVTLTFTEFQMTENSDVLLTGVAAEGSHFHIALSPDVVRKISMHYSDAEQELYNEVLSKED